MMKFAMINGVSEHNPDDTDVLVIENEEGSEQI
jgi:hypothetical protein